MSTAALVVSDTHLRDDGRRRLPREVLAAAERADVIFHAGDVTVVSVLDDLAGFAPVHAVLGNNDLSLFGRLPERLEVEVGGVRIGMVHDAGPSAGRPRRLRRMFPEADVVVFGHSHQPLAEPGEDGQLLLNPGSPTERRRAPTHTYGWLELDGGVVVTHRIVHLAG